jgi:hypothetical protein
MLPRPTGAGAPEPNWADVKVAFDKKNDEPWEGVKKVKTYGMSRRDPSLSGKCSSSLKDDAWSEADESWDGPGLDKWDYAGTAALAMHATGRRF